MKKIITAFILLLFVSMMVLWSAKSFGQNKIYYAAGRTTDTAFTPGSWLLNYVIRATYYATADTNKVLGIDAQGYLTLRTKSTGGGGSADSAVFYTNYRADTSKAAIYGQLATRVKYTDTAAMLTPYALLTELPDITGKVNYTDTAAMLLPYAREANLADTAAVLRGLIPAGTDTTSLSNRIDARVKYTDTATMLTPYLRKVDTTAMLGGYLRKVDTSTLSNRINLKANTASPTFTGTVTIPTGANITTPNILGLTSGSTNDSIVVADATSGALKRISSSRISSGGGGGGGANAWHITGDTATVNKVFGTTSTISSHRIDFKVGNEIVGYMGWTTAGFRYGSFMSRASNALNYDALCLGGEGHISTGIRSVTIGGVGTKALGTNAIGMGGGAAESNDSWAWGSQNTYANGANSAAFGGYANSNNFTGCFNFSDFSEASFSNNTANNQFMAKYANGFVIKTAASGTTPLSNAALEVISTTKAFYPPRMTTTQRDAMAGVQAGAVIYNSTTNKHQGYDGTTWNDLY